MGLTLFWIAIRKTRGAELLQRLGLERAGDASDELEASYCCAETPEGWLVLTLGTAERELDRAVSQAPAGAAVLAFEMSEIVMFSRARAFRDGNPVWSVTHDPDSDRHGVAVEGDCPPQLSAIRKRLEAEEAAHAGEGVDYLFDIPLDLSRALCGYQPLVSLGLEWSILKRVPRPRTGGTKREPSLLQGMRSELVPLLRSLGWDVPGDRPNLGDPGGISRRLNGEEQLIWFEYGQGTETFITVFFALVDERRPEGGLNLVGHVVRPIARIPLWKRFSWKRFVALANAPPTPMDVGSILAQARGEIVIADTFLKTGELNNRVTVEDRRSWPWRQPPTEGPT